MRVSFSCFFTLLFLSSFAQSYRGIAVLSDTECWVSGSRGTVLKTMDGGERWDTVSPAGYSTKDFRDIHVFSSNEAIVMSSGDSAVVLKTTDGGRTWVLVHSNYRPGVFYDAMDFKDSIGVIIGDPYRQGEELKFDMMFSCDGGNTWNCESFQNYYTLPAEEGEALYAASGSNVVLSTHYDVEKPGRFAIVPLFVTGGMRSALYAWQAVTALPFDTCATCGAYGMAMARSGQIVIVGGNYLEPDSGKAAAVFYNQETNRFELAKTPPGGYRSGVAFAPDNQILVCTGTNGSDISMDNGATWNPLSVPGFNTLAFSSNYLWLAGDKGRVLREAIHTLY